MAAFDFAQVAVGGASLAQWTVMVVSSDSNDRGAYHVRAMQTPLQHLPQPFAVAQIGEKAATKQSNYATDERNSRGQFTSDCE